MRKVSDPFWVEWQLWVPNYEPLADWLDICDGNYQMLQGICQQKYLSFHFLLLSQCICDKSLVLYQDELGLGVEDLVKNWVRYNHFTPHTSDYHDY